MRHVRVNFGARSSAVEHRVHIAGVAGSNPAEPKKMIRFYYRSIQSNTLKRIKNFRNGSFIYVFTPSENDFYFLNENFNLDESLLKDGLDPYEISRIEQKNNKVYIFLRAPFLKAKEEFFTTTLLIIISDNFFVIFSKEKNFIIDKFIIKNKKNIITTQRTKLFIQILSEIYEYFNYLILKINKEVRKMAFEVSDVGEKEIKKTYSFRDNIKRFL